jgi:hypothetical protein
MRDSGRGKQGVDFRLFIGFAIFAHHVRHLRGARRQELDRERREHQLPYSLHHDVPFVMRLPATCHFVVANMTTPFQSGSHVPATWAA